MNFYRDLTERTIATYIQTFLGLLIASWTDAVDVSTLRSAAVAAIPAGLAVIKGFAARKVGTVDSASFVE